MPSALTTATVLIVVPARNEEDSIGRCLESLLGQQGVAFQITVVDDGSSDGTRAIAKSFARVGVIRASEPASGAIGKSNALIQGAAGPPARWLLFTDADTVHYPGSLAKAVAEAEERGVDLLSYSPEQETISWGERVLLPVIFAELTRVYPSDRVNDPADPTAAANGQYLLVRRDPYLALGGHQAVVDKVLEDVELARLFKRSGYKIWFRYGAGLVRARMYRDLHSLVEGWTKNLALLFDRPVRLAGLRAAEFSLIAASLLAAPRLLLIGDHGIGLAILAAGALLYGSFLWRIHRAHFPWVSNLISVFGLPLFSWLLLRSWLHLRMRGTVTWKGRTYTGLSGPAQSPAPNRVRETSVHEGSKAEG